MTNPQWARLYLWARQLRQAEPTNPEARWLVALLRQWDDLERRRRAWPETTPANLQRTVEETIRILVWQLERAEGSAA